jgi:hypothetical protein
LTNSYPIGSQITSNKLTDIQAANSQVADSQVVDSQVTSTQVICKTANQLTACYSALAMSILSMRAAP